MMEVQPICYLLIAKEKEIDKFFKSVVQSGNRLLLYVKKPECPARKSGDEWPWGF
jgi:hypothetical protein